MKKLEKLLIGFTTCIAIGALASCGGGSNPTPTPSTCIHVDKDKNHVCDLCSYVMSDHYDYDKNHECDLCGTIVSQHLDENNDHKCDLCSLKLTEHVDENKDHICEYCFEKISQCYDDNKDHKCDYCEKVLSACEDEDHDHKCDYCEKVLTECDDKNHDHKCDWCQKVLSQCEDTNNDHYCEYCSQKCSDCIDTNPTDHYCDICSNKLSDCIDENYDYYCDICGEEVTPTTKNPRIVTNLSSPAFSYANGTDLSLVDGNETLYKLELTKVEVGFEFYISTYKTIYKNWITTKTDTKDAYNTTCFSINGSGVAHFNVAGDFIIYFETGDTNTGISVTAKTVTSDYKMYETVGSETGWNVFGFAYESGEHSRVTYQRMNQVFATNEIIYIKKGSAAQRFTFTTNLNSSKWSYFNGDNYDYVRILTKISDYCRVKLFVSLEDMSLTLDIRYEVK